MEVVVPGDAIVGIGFVVTAVDGNDFVDRVELELVGLIEGVV